MTVRARSANSFEFESKPCKGSTVGVQGLMGMFLGVDGGGSKTWAIVVDAEMELLGEGRSGPSNHLRVGIDEATRAVTEAVSAAVAAAGITLEDVTHTYCGIAGSDHPLHRFRVVASLQTFFPAGNFTVDSDARIALTGGIGFGPGIVVVSGTGSVAFGRNRTGREVRAGGWGPTLGDEGSGYAIAREGLTAVVRAEDGRGPATRLTDLLCEAHGMCDPEDLSYFVYAPSTHADDIARYGRLVIEAAREKDEVAAGILRRAGDELGRSVVAVAERLSMLNEEFPVAYLGGAFHAAELLIDPMTERIHLAAPQARVVPPIASPAMGAASLAIRASMGERPTRPGVLRAD